MDGISLAIRERRFRIAIEQFAQSNNCIERRAQFMSCLSKKIRLDPFFA